MSDEETKISNSHKWQLQELFEDFFKKTPLAKGHLEKIEENWRQELRETIAELTNAIDESAEDRAKECHAQIKKLEKKLINQMQDLEDQIKPLKFAFLAAKWAGGVLLTVLAGALLNETLF